MLYVSNKQERSLSFRQKHTLALELVLAYHFMLFSQVICPKLLLAIASKGALFRW